MNKKHLQLTGFAFFFLLLSACSQTGIVPLTMAATPTPTVEPTQTALPTPTPLPPAECNPETPPDFTDYATWTKINDRPIKGHESRVYVYVDDLAKEIYLSASGKTFPVCAKIVKTHLVGSDFDLVSAITVMVKMPAGYDPEHNNWWWGMYDKTGKIAEMSREVQVCIECHQPVAEADYVFSQAVMAESNK